MKRFLSVLMLILVGQALSSQTAWNLQLNSFMGGAIYPKNKQLTEKMIYLQKYDFSFNLTYKNKNGLILKTQLQNKEVELRQVLIIKKVSALYQKKSLKMGFLKDEIGYGKNSYIFNRHFNNTFYDKFISESFNFYGMDVYKDFGKMTAEIKIGGNTFNKELMDFNMKFGSTDYIKLFDMFAFSDNDKNKRINSLGLEFTKNFEDITVSGFWDNKFFISSDDDEKTSSKIKITLSRLFFAEINYRINQNFGIGYNFLQDSINIMKNGKHLAYLSAKKGNWDADVEYSYYDFKDFFDRKVSANLKYKFGLINIEGMLGYAIPSLGTNRIEMGLTVGLDYEKN